MGDSGSWLRAAQWMLVGPHDRLTPRWLLPLLLTCGSAEDWAALGLEVNLDSEGQPTWLDIGGRDYAFTWISDLEAAAFPTCASRGVRAPAPFEVEASAGKPSSVAG